MFWIKYKLLYVLHHFTSMFMEENIFFWKKEKKKSVKEEIMEIHIIFSRNNDWLRQIKAYKNVNNWFSFYARDNIDINFLDFERINLII